MALLSEEGKLYFTGNRMYYKPKLFEIDYSENEVQLFTACDKGAALLTKEGKIFYHGNYWGGKYEDHDVATGIK